MSTASTTMQEKEESKPRPIFAYLAVALALATPLVQIAMRPVWELFPFPVDRFFSLWPFWIIAALVLFYSVKIEGIPLATFGITKNTRSLRYRLIEMIVALLLGTVIMIVLILFARWVGSLTGVPETGPVDLVNVLPFWVTLPAWITAGFFEELLFRSYPIERLLKLGHNRWIAAGIPMLAFALTHVPTWGWVHFFTIGLPSSFIISLIYLKHRSLWFVVIIHALFDIPLLLLPFIAPYL
jgi:membrane protease YdiL (CAAX protease family)